MQRTTITLDDDLMTRLDEFMSERQYANRSEAIRDLVRSGLQKERFADVAGYRAELERAEAELMAVQELRRRLAGEHT